MYTFCYVFNELIANFKYRKFTRITLLAFFGIRAKCVPGETTGWLIPIFSLTFALITSGSFYVLDHAAGFFDTIARFVSWCSLVYTLSHILVQWFASVDDKLLEVIIPYRIRIAETEY